MVRGAAAVLSPASRPPLLALAAFLAYEAVLPRLPDAGRWPGIAVTALVGLPLLGLVVVLLAGLEPRDRPLPLLCAGVLVGIAAAAVMTHLGWVGGAGASKAVAAAAAGSLLARALGSPLEAAAIALVVIGVDTYSVLAGPTKAIIDHHPDVLSAFSVDVAGPGRTTGAALGVTDLFFLAALTRAAARLGLRAKATAAAMCASLGLSLVAAAALDRAVPALPALSLAWLCVNADLLVAAARGRQITP